jgi:4-carboxymuconolactone decarboxylase
VSTKDKNRRQKGLTIYSSQLRLSVAEVEKHFTKTYGRAFAEDAFQAAGGSTWEDTPLDVRERSLLVIAILAALGGVEPRLENHVRWAIDHGATVDEIHAAIGLVANYAGFARASVAIEAANRALNDLC